MLVEYKLKEPRTHCFVNSAAKVLLLLAGIDKVGVLLDVGHAMPRLRKRPRGGGADWPTTENSTTCT